MIKLEWDIGEVKRSGGQLKILSVRKGKIERLQKGNIKVEIDLR